MITNSTPFPRKIWEKATAETRTAIDALTAPIRRQIFDEWVVVFDPATQEALKKTAADRTPLQRQLAQLAIKQIERKYGRITRRMTAVQKAHYESLQNTLATFDKLKPPTPPTAMAAGDVGPTVPATHRLSGGNPLKPRDEVAPAFLECLGPAEPQIKPLPNSSGRRSALAQWLTRPDHPLTARVFVNRLWQHYFGQALVATPNDFGAMGEAPTHPELLDFLATELVRNGWRAKAVHRLIVTSAAYRQSSQPTLNPTLTAALKTDPDDKLLWHARMRRRDAESLRDTALQVSGNLSLRMFGASSRPELPGELADNRYAWAADTRPEDRNRRSVYLISKRNLRLPLFAAFDAPDRLSSCPARAETVNAPQALALLNGPFFGPLPRRLPDHRPRRRSPRPRPSRLSHRLQPRTLRRRNGRVRRLPGPPVPPDRLA
jgi:hypothetical protein